MYVYVVHLNEYLTSWLTILYGVSSNYFCVCCTYIHVYVCTQAFILVCLLAWFSKTQTCHRLMAHLFQSAEITGLTDSPAQLQLPLPPPVTTPIHGEYGVKSSFQYICIMYVEDNGTCTISFFVSDKNLLKTMDQTLQSLPTVAVDNQTPPHMQFLNDRGLPTSSNDNLNSDIGDSSKTAATSANDRGDPIANGNEHWTDSMASTLNSSDVRIVRVERDGFGVKCDGGEACWRPMVTTHWPRLLRHFGYTVESRSECNLN